MVLHLLEVPARSNTKEEASTREEVESRNGLCRHDRVALYDEAETRPHAQGRRGCSCRRECDEGIQQATVFAREFPPTRSGGSARCWDVRVIGKEE